MLGAGVVFSSSESSTAGAFRRVAAERVDFRGNVEAMFAAEGAWVSRLVDDWASGCCEGRGLSTSPFMASAGPLVGCLLMSAHGHDTDRNTLGTCRVVSCYVMASGVPSFIPQDACISPSFGHF